MINKKSKNTRHLRGSTEKCPKCGCKAVNVDVNAVVAGFGPGLACCINCDAIWEPFDPAQIWDKDDHVCSFKEPCDNCAFRPGSNEQQDREKWIQLIKDLKKGAMFFCHKGVPIEPDSEHGFAYSKDRTKLRICRGFLNALKGFVKEYKEESGKITINIDD